MPTVRANLFLQMVIVVPRVEQDVDPAPRGYMRCDLVEHLGHEDREFVKGQLRFGAARAIELPDQLAG